MEMDRIDDDMIMSRWVVGWLVVWLVQKFENAEEFTEEYLNQDQDRGVGWFCFVNFFFVVDEHSVSNMNTDKI